YNVVHVDLPEGEGDQKYEAAAATFRAWQEREVLIRDPRPSIYAYHQSFRTPDGASHTRKGLLALLRAAPFSERVVFPHERTLAPAREDRLKLMTACRAQLSPIFLL